MVSDPKMSGFLPNNTGLEEFILIVGAHLNETVLISNKQPTELNNLQQIQ